MSIWSVSQSFFNHVFHNSWSKFQVRFESSSTLCIPTSFGQGEDFVVRRFQVVVLLVAAAIGAVQKTLEEAVAALKGCDRCRVCLDELAGVAFTPCAHLVVCRQPHILVATSPLATTNWVGVNGFWERCPDLYSGKPTLICREKNSHGRCIVSICIVCH